MKESFGTGVPNHNKDNSKLKKTFKIATLGIALLTSNQEVAGQSIDSDTPSHPQYSETDKDKTSVEHDTAQVQKELIKKTGIDVEEIAKRYGFKAELEIDNGDGPYIFHIGQLHRSPYEENETIEEIKKVVESQKNIAGLLSSLKNKDPSINFVFTEGQTNDSSMKAMASEIRHSFDEKILKKEGATLPDLASYYQKVSGRLGNSMPEKIAQVTLNHIFEQKVHEMALLLKQKNPDIDYTAEESKMILAIKHIIPELGKDEEYYFIGGVEVLELDHEIEVIPAEEKSEEIDALLKKQKKLVAQIDKHPQNEESLQDEFVKNVDLSNKIVYENRENAVLHKISKVDNATHHRIYPVIFGNRHSFKDGILKDGNNNNQRKMGLIKFSIIQD